ncbi:TetR family transcriptional regulator C-terminal domain-containing protein [Kitasatospora sp. NPDC094019]|uniref:TetR family transcriptional regulator C-terminal domain-containing protein n=1 Tax=Kitasatospora sp. NPDC094019 TaxID=3364091 RepID=UPI00380CB5AA
MAGIRSFFTSAFETGLEHDPGCLLTDTAVESFTVSQAAAGVRRGLETIESGFADALTRARALGLLSADLDVEASAARLLALYQGLLVLVLVRSGTPVTNLHTITGGAMASIGSDEEGQR